MLVVRRVRAARGLLLATAGAALIATLLLTGLASYSRDVVAAGGRAAVRSAPTEERSLLVRGSSGDTAATAADRDTKMRARFAGGLAGRPVQVWGAGYAIGQQLTGDTGDAVPDSGGVVYASVGFLDDLPARAELVTGAWAQPGARPAQVTIAEAAAARLGISVGDRLPIADRRSGRVTRFRVAGVWRPRDPGESYWRLAPGVTEGGVPGSHTYGPIVLAREDFLRGYVNGATLGWLAQPELAGAGLGELQRVRRELGGLVAGLPDRVGLGSSGTVNTRLDRLVDRLTRADLVGRSTLVTPMLLIAVVSGYTLLLVALLLSEHRRTERAVLRARGAARAQLAGLAVREATLIVLPAAVLAPLLVRVLLPYAGDSPLLASGALRMGTPSTGLIWTVGVAAAAGCLLAVVRPELRRGGTYVEELTGRARPSRWAGAQRAGVDLALVAFAVLAWLQLRQYASPVARVGSALGVDPLLAAAPTIGVLAGAVLALRLLPPATRLAERYVDRRRWTALVLGMWQAGRRAHAGPVLLLALAVAVSTLAWCLAATVARSQRDQAEHTVGTDLRLAETSGFAPADRPAQLAKLTHTRTVLPARQVVVTLGADQTPADFLALDAVAAAPMVHYRPDLAAGGAPGVFGRLAAARTTAPAVPLRPDTRRLTGRLALKNVGEYSGEVPARARTYAVVADEHGRTHRLLLGGVTDGEAGGAFTVPLPAGPRLLYGFDVTIDNAFGSRFDWRLDALTEVDASGRRRPLILSGPATNWRVVDGTTGEKPNATAGWPGSLALSYQVPPTAFGAAGFSVTHLGSVASVPAVATPAALRALRTSVGRTSRLRVAGGEVDVRIIGEVAAVPGTSGRPAALLADLPSLTAALYHNGVSSPVEEWWVATEPGSQATVAAEAAELEGIEVHDPVAIAAAAGREPYGVGARGGLFAAALGALLLALVGVAVDARATASRRAGELAVLHAMGAGPRLLARAQLAEQAFLAGLGVVVGLLIGMGVAATMTPLVILTPAAERPVPVPLLAVPWLPVTATAAGILAVALLMSTLTAGSARQRVTAAQLRIGQDT